MSCLIHRLMFLLSCLPISLSFSAEPLKPFASWQFENTGQSQCLDGGDLRLDGSCEGGLGAGIGRRGQAPVFNQAGSNQAVEIQLDHAAQSAVTKMLGSSFTLELWVNDETPTPNGRTNYSLFYKADRAKFTANSLWFYRARQDGSYRFTIRDRNNRVASINFGPITPTGYGDRQWHHYAIVADRSSNDTGDWRLRGYRDGTLIIEAAIPADLLAPNNAGDLLIGNHHHRNAPWLGSIDEVALHARPLTASQIHRRIQLADEPPTPVIRLDDQLAREHHFESHIRPLFVNKCAGCHDGKPNAKSNLTLTSRQALLAGAEFGPSIVPGKADESQLIHAVKWTHRELRMPPDKDDRLSADEVAALVQWVNDGAVWPGDSNQADASQSLAGVDRIGPREPLQTDHWSFQPRSRPKVPAVKVGLSPIDQFVFAAMEEEGLSPNPPAGKRTLIRRVTFDLIGLPPTPDEVVDFLSDDSSDAYARLIDRLLDSPHYGERWGRHWLDIARYADTQGDVGDFPIPTAYLYRNWVIDALNADMPYNRFIQAQIAGDLIAQDVDGPDEARRLNVATGFIALSRRFGNTKYLDLHLTIEDTLDTIGRGIMGMTMRCARCHDHKFDPVLQSDYFGLYGIFQSTRYPTMGASNEKSPSELAAAIPDPETQRDVDHHFETLARYAYQINNHFRPWLKPTLSEYRSVNKQLGHEGLSPDTRRELAKQRHELLNAYEGKFRELMLHGIDWIRKTYKRMGNNPPVELVYAVSESEPTEARVHLRGNPETLGPEVPRRFLNVLGNGTLPTMSGSGRLELARWITADDHPLTARVIVNRIWQQHFGRGIVRTASNFGVQGDSPSHPELLDYLANEFVETHNWSMKSLHRRIMLSYAYRQSSLTDAAKTNQDPGNKWLARFVRRRHDAEVIRDSILAVSGRLDRSRRGAFPFPHWTGARYSLNAPFKGDYHDNRRSLYQLTQRLFRNPFFALFDGPDRNSSTAQRGSSTLPTQVLYLMNSPFIQEQATAFADRIIRHSDDAAALDFTWRTAYSRPPTDAEAVAVFHQVSRMTEGLSKPITRKQTWTAIAKAIFTSNEFLYSE